MYSKNVSLGIFNVYNNDAISRKIFKCLKYLPFLKLEDVTLTFEEMKTKFKNQKSKQLF